MPPAVAELLSKCHCQVCMANKGGVLVMQVNWTMALLFGRDISRF